MPKSVSLSSSFQQHLSSVNKVAKLFHSSKWHVRIERLTQRSRNSELEKLLKNQSQKNNISALVLLTGEKRTISGATKNSQIDWHFNGRKNHTSPYGSLKQKPLGFMTNISLSL